MNKILAVILLCFGFVTSMSSQALSFNANTTNTSIAIGDTVIVDVTTSNFIGIEFYQYTMEWNPSSLELIDLVDCNADIGLNCTLGVSNFNETSPGVMRTIWPGLAGSSASLADGTKVFTIRLKAKADGDMNIRFTDSGLSREAVGTNGEFEGDALLTSVSGSATVGSGNGGGGSVGDLGFTVGDLTGVVGTEVCVPVTVANFDSVIFYQYTMEWDASILELVRLDNCNSDISLNCSLGQSNFNETSAGILRHLWSDAGAVGKDLAENAVLFELCFDLKAVGNTSISITEGELDINAETVAAGEIDASVINTTNGTATVTAAGGGGNGGGGTVGDLGFTVGDLTGEVGTEVCVPVTVANFDSVVFYQYTMEWDASILELVRLDNCNSDIALNCTLGQSNFNETSAGILRHLWSDAAAQGKDLADNAVLFEMCFDLKAAGNTTIAITDSELDINAETVAAGEIDASVINTTNGSATVTAAGGGNGGGGTVGDLGFTVGDLTGEVGSEVCVPVTVANFDSVIFYQYTMEWDASILELVRLDNCNSDISLNCTLGQSNFNETSPGVLRHIWSDAIAQGKDLADNAVLFEMCFDLKAAGNTSIAITDSELDINAETVAAGEIDASVINTTNGSATVTAAGGGGGGNGGGGTVGDLGFTVGDLTGEVGSEVCVPVTVANFDSVIFYQYTMEWDASILELVRLDNCNSDISLNCTLGQSNFNETSPGVLRHIWSDAIAQGKDLVDNAVLFEMCFDLKAAGNTSIAITDSELDINAETVAAGEIDASVINTTNGSATVTAAGGGGGGNGGGGTVGDLGFTVGDLTGEVGSEVCIPVTVANFDSVIFYQYTMEWDASILELVRLDNCNSDISLNCTLGQSNFNETSPGVLRHIWSDAIAQGKDLADNAVLFEMCFDLKAVGNTTIAITDSELDINAETVAAGEIDASVINTTNGSATVTAAGGGGGGNGGGGTVGDLGFTVGDLTGEVGSEVCVPVTVANFDSVIFYQYTMEWDASILELVRLDNCNSDISLNCTLGQSNFNETSPGVLRHIWSDAIAQGKDLADNAVLFEMCFDLKAAGNTSIAITDSELDINAETVAAGEIDASVINTTNGSATVTAAGGGGGGNGGGGTVGDLGFTVGDLTGEVGSEVCIPVTVANFDSVIFYQYTMEWDASILELVRLDNCNSDISLNCTLGQSNFNETSPGVLRHIWSDAIAQGKDLADNAVLFEMCFDLKAVGNTTIAITDSELDINAETVAAGEIDASVINTTNGSATVTAAGGGGGGNGGGGTVGDLGFTVGDLTGEVGSEVCIPVTVANFDSVIFYQYTMEWDASILELVRLDNCNSDISLNCTLGQSNFNETSPGVLRHIWSDAIAQGKDLADNAVLFEMCFDLKAAGNTSIAITDSELDINAETVAAGEIDASVINTTNGTATVTAAGGGGGGGGMTTGPLKFSTTSANVEADASTCLNVMVENFVDITTFSMSQTWDASVFELEGVMSCNAALTGLNCGLGNANFTIVGSNRVDITWTDASGTGVTIPTGEALFQLCFKAIGDPGEGTNVAYGTNISASNKDGALSADDIETQDAQISINGVTNNGQLTFIAEGKMADVGETVCLQITTENFDKIVFFQYTMEWDASVLELENLNACNTDLDLNCDIINNITNFNQTSDGSLRASWTDAASVGKTIADGSVLYEICFKVIGQGGDNSLVRFTSNEIAIEAQDDVDFIDEADIVVQNGFVSVNDNGGNNTPALVFNISEETGRQNDTVCVAVTADNFDDIIHFQYNIEWNTAVLQFLDVDACTSKLEGLNCVSGPTSSNFNESSAGLLRTSWIHTPTTGASLSSEDTLFLLCFKLVGNSGASSAIRITDSELDIEASNPAGDITANNIILNNGKINIVTVMPVANIDRVQSTDILCNGASTGAIDIDVSGGLAPLTYSWTNGATTQDIDNVPAGTYRVSVTDAENRVIVSDPIQLFEPSAMAIGNIQVTQPNAETSVQGSIDIAVSGGSSPYTFVWSNGATSEDIAGLVAGCYTVTITDRNGCTFTPAEICVEAEVTALAALNTNPGNVICATDANGTIAFSFNGGIAPFTFTLSTGASLTSSDRNGTFDNLPIGDYTVVVTDAENDNLTASATVDFTSSFFVEGAVITTYNGFDVSGFGRTDATITASANGTVGPYQYAWSDNLGMTGIVANVGAGTYTVTITDGNGCVQSTQIVVNEPQLLVANATADLMPGCKNVCEGEASVNVEGGVAPYDFLWSTGSTQGVLFDLCAGDYTVSVTDANSVTTISAISVVEPDSLTLSFEATEPTTLTGSDGSAMVTVSGGTAPYTYQWNDNNGTQTPEVTGLSPDTYFIIVTDANGCQKVGMVDVERPTADCFESRNIITIDGDGMNENLIIQCADNVQNTLQIFNRWGQLVFDATNYDNTWEGTDRRGNKLPEGGYFWVLRVTEADNSITEHKNHVTIITAE